ncbi:hypothetical protein [Massilia timonae]|uniref:hypothetical protein n=1 Tax=Massilia timonae TaxID=47229 RepID=UPI000EE6A064|nr:hypothetical protein [Massilia timonae]HAK92470.1 hypothetical protein [Massilia timonae]
MASIFDMFGGSPQSQGLLAATAQILQASGPSFRPAGLGQILGSGLQAYQQTEQQAREQGQLQQMRGLQIQGAESDLKAQELARQRAQEYQTLVKSYQLTRGAGQAASAAPQDRSGAAMFSGLMNGSAPTISAPGEQQAMATPLGAPTDARNALVQEGLQFAKYLSDNGYRSEAQSAAAEALKMQPKVKEWQKVTAGGKTMYAPYFEDGTHGQPVPLQVAQALERVNVGGTTELIDSFTGQTVRSITNTVDPNTRANNAVTINGQVLADRRARELNEITRQGQQSQLVNDPTQGPMLVDKGTGQARQVMLNGRPVLGETAAKKEAAAKNLMPLITDAEKLIKGATGSYLGAAADHAARWYGHATPGAQNIAQLSVLEGNLMMAQPRMEGPQSNMDVALYKQMAAQIGDPTVPYATKKAALTTLKSLYKKYVPDPAAEPNSASGGVKFLGFE